MCVQVDGVEYEKIGLDLYEMSDVLMTMGLVHAVVRMYTSHTLSHSLTHVYTHALTHTLKLSLSLSHTHTHTPIMFPQNLDGGGSSVSVYRGQVVSRPTCTDTAIICERPVTSITCLTPT